MIPITMIDTLKISESFEEAGFDREKAKVLVEAIKEAQSQSFEALATKQDIKESFNELKQNMASKEDLKAFATKQNLKDTEHDLKQEIFVLQQDNGDVKKDIKNLENKMDQKFELMRSEIRNAMLMTIISLGGIVTLIEKFIK